LLQALTENGFTELEALVSLKNVKDAAPWRMRYEFA